MVRAVLVKHLGERKIVIANNSISKKFASTRGNICGITWNGCNVDEDTFVAILNEQNLEVEALSLPVSKLYSSSFCQSLNDFSPVKNPVYTDLENFHASSPQQCLSLPVTNLESTADVTEPVFIQEALPQKCAFSQSSLAGISSQPSYTAQVAFTSNPLTNAIQKDLIFKKLPNNYRQRQYTKCHSLKVKRLPQVSVSNSNRKLKPVVTELVANQEQLLKDVENELKKKKPSQPTLSILNRQLFDNETFSMIPKRINFAPTLMLEEAIRFYVDFKDAIIKIQAMLFWISPESGNHTENLSKLQQKLISKKTCDKLFMKVDCDSIGEYIRVPSSYGP
ncbi:uncharacterized protein LOC124819362 isoform X2 [Hydra vulgaris]|uniref:uncharacterized protein LOC124819362 isoform X2 n=1 Tax=Hydra vulgaris TaxID=6087 RepID=UPI0032EA0116